MKKHTDRKTHTDKNILTIHNNTVHRVLVGGRLECNKDITSLFGACRDTSLPLSVASLFISSIIRHCLSKNRKTTESTKRCHSSSSVLSLICLSFSLCYPLWIYLLFLFLPTHFSPFFLPLMFVCLQTHLSICVFLSLSLHTHLIHIHPFCHIQKEHLILDSNSIKGSPIQPYIQSIN